MNPGDRADVFAEQIIRSAFNGGGCEQLSEVMTRLSRKLVLEARKATRVTELERTDNSHRGRMRREMRERVLHERFRNRRFWEILWTRVAEAFRSCDQECFADGEAVGQISGLGYCGASTAAEGLPGVGFAVQPSLPICGTAIHVGCRLGYQDAVEEFEGCREYASGAYDRTFNEYVSQDCLVDEGLLGDGGAP